MSTPSAAPTIDRRSMLAAGALALTPGLFTRGARAASLAAQSAAAPIEAPRFHRFKVGSIECVALNDGTIMLNGVQPTFASKAPKDELDAALDRAFHPRDRAMLEFNAIALKIGTPGGGEWVLIDCGYGENGAPTTGKIPANLRAAGIAPESISAIFISHAHGDHINGVLTKEGALAYPNARYIMSRIEHDFWTNNPDLSKLAFGDQQKREFTANAQKHIAAIKPKLELIDGSSKLFSQLAFEPTPGHTPGHTSLVLRDGSEELFILADAAHNHVVMFADPTWGPIFDTEPDVAAATRRRLWDRLATDRTKVMAFHLPWPGLGHVRRAGAAHEWLIAAEGL